MTDEHNRPPIRFVDAEQINPFRVLLDLHDQAIGRPATRSLHDVLAELALAAAVVSWWTRWQPMSIHAALRAGADLTDIAAATGLEPAEVVRRWRRWTDRPDPTGHRRTSGRGQGGPDRPAAAPGGGEPMTPTRVARNVSTAAVATIAAWSSWSHRVHVPLRYGERPEVAYVLLISVDGMLNMASAAMVEDKRNGNRVRWSARIAYADDLVVCCHSQEQAQQIKEQLAEWLAPRGLAFNEDKTTIVALEQGFDFLAFNVRRYRRGKLLIKPSKTAVKRIRERRATEVRALRGANVIAD